MGELREKSKYLLKFMSQKWYFSPALPLIVYFHPNARNQEDKILFLPYPQTVMAEREKQPGRHCQQIGLLTESLKRSWTVQMPELQSDYYF